MTQLDLFSWKPRRRRQAWAKSAHEWKIISLRETAPDTFPPCTSPKEAVRYWRTHIANAPHFNPDVECFAVLLLNTKQRVRGHHIVSIGGLNETLAHAREVFRAAVIGAAHGVVLMHNHPSGDPTPSDADRRTTKRLMESGHILQIAVLDHVIVGHPGHCSMRESGMI